MDPMDKELLLIVYKIYVGGLTKSEANLLISEMKGNFSLIDDEELKLRYIVREVWLPTIDTISSVEVIYPHSCKCC